MNDQRNHLAVRVFLFICAVAIAVSAISFLRDRQSAIDSLLFNHRADNHMDFYNSVVDDASLDVYERGTLYPPLINLAYYCVSKLFPGVRDLGALGIAATQKGKIVYYIIQLFGVALFLWGCWLNTSKLTIWERICFLFVTVLSAPVLYAFERGNAIIYAVALVLLFMNTVSLPDEKRALRELGLIALAVSANIKFYPALFGLILIKKKRYKEAARCVLYGILLFVIPMWIYGGKIVIKTILLTVQTMNNVFLSIGLGYKIGWHNFGDIVSRTLDLTLPIDVNSFMTALVLVGLLLCRRDNMIYWGAALLCVGFPVFSFNYNALYMLIPICCFLNDSVTKRIGEKRNDGLIAIAAVFLALTIAPWMIGGFAPFNRFIPPYGGEWQFLNVTTVVCCFSVTALGLIYFWEAFMENQKRDLAAL